MRGDAWRTVSPAGRQAAYSPGVSNAPESDLAGPRLTTYATSRVAHVSLPGCRYCGGVKNGVKGKMSEYAQKTTRGV